MRAIESEWEREANKMRNRKRLISSHGVEKKRSCSARRCKTGFFYMHFALIRIIIVLLLLLLLLLAILLHTKLHCLVKVKTVQRARPWLTIKRQNCTSSYSSCSDAVAHNSCTSQLKVSKKQSHENLYRSFTLATVVAATAHYQQSKFERKKNSTTSTEHLSYIIASSERRRGKMFQIIEPVTRCLIGFLTTFSFHRPTAFVWCCERHNDAMNAWKTHQNDLEEFIERDFSPRAHTAASLISSGTRWL